MLRYILRRTLYAIPILLGVFVVTFFLFYLTATPEQMARRNLGKNPTPQQVQDWIREHGYDKPLLHQFLKNGRELLFFQFGKSDATGDDIWTNIRERVGPSITIAGMIFLSALITDIFIAVFLAYFRGTYVDYAGVFVCVLCMSVSYVVYLIAGQYVLAKILKYFPMAGFREGLIGFKFVVMPMVIGVIAGLGTQVRLYRTFLLDETNQDYVRTARAKGVQEQRVLFLHVLKNAAIPILTSLVAQIPLLLLGGLLIESFFAVPGIGGYTFDAINSQDFAVVRAMVFLGSVLYVVGYTLTDMTYAWADPRVRLE